MNALNVWAIYNLNAAVAWVNAAAFLSKIGKRSLTNFIVEFVEFSEMCPKPTETRNVSRQSHVEDLEGIPGLFKALTEDEDDGDDDKWSTIIFPVDFPTITPKGEKTYKFVLRKSPMRLANFVLPRTVIMKN